MESKDHVTAAPAPTVAPAPVVDTSPKSYLAMMLLAIFMMPTGLARAYRGEQAGWTRFWIYVGLQGGAIILWWIPFLNLLIFLGILGFFVWGAVDVFLLRGVRVDAAGGPLVSTPRDDKFAKGFFITFLVGLIVTAACLLVAMIFSAVLIALFHDQINNAANHGLDSSQTQWLNQFDSQYR